MWTFQSWKIQKISFLNKIVRKLKSFCGVVNIGRKISFTYSLCKFLNTFSFPTNFPLEKLYMKVYRETIFYFMQSEENIIFVSTFRKLICFSFSLKTKVFQRRWKHFIGKNSFNFHWARLFLVFSVSNSAKVRYARIERWKKKMIKRNLNYKLFVSEHFNFALSLLKETFQPIYSFVSFILKRSLVDFLNIKQIVHFKIWSSLSWLSFGKVVMKNLQRNFWF